MKEKTKAWTPDASQQYVINLQEGPHLVLAAPGCGKTQILTERIRKALERGVAVEDMLCLTFTNRAARGMMERIESHIEGNDISNIYVGNVHRLCFKFLFENQLNIEKFIKPKYNRKGPILVGGDAVGDENMLTEFRDTEVLLIMKREGKLDNLVNDKRALIQYRNLKTGLLDPKN